MKLFLEVGAFGLCGVWIRFLCDQFNATQGWVFPWSTLTVNLLGSFAAGIFLGLQGISPEMRQLGLIGFCGGLTTFSGVSLQVMQMLLRGEWFLASGYLVASPLLGVVLASLGYLLSKAA